MTLRGRNSAANIEKLADFRKSIDYMKELKILVNSNFLELKNELISKFNNHLVTREIEAGPDATNISGTLGGYGNLFSFIGFKKGDDPIQPIRKAFDNIVLTSMKVDRKGTSLSYVMFPSADDIFKITPLPWAEGRSWAKGIESGISGLGYYLNLAEKGRSSAGLQSEEKVGDGGFRNVKYISALINDFERKIKTLNGLRIL